MPPTADRVALMKVIRLLRRKDRWRLHKRNKGAIRYLQTVVDTLPPTARSEAL